MVGVRQYFVLPSRERLVLASIFLCLLLGMILRFYNATAKSLHADEFVTLYEARRLDTISPGTEVGGWLVYWAGRLGSQDFILRFPAIMCGVVTLAVVYRLARSMFGRVIALLALFLFTISPFHIAYSQYIRHYAYLLLFASLTYYFLYKAITAGRRWDWLGLAISVSLVLRTQPVSRVIWITQGVVCSLVFAIELGLYAIRVWGHLPPGLRSRISFQCLKTQWANLAVCQALIAILSYREVVLVMLNYYARPFLRRWVSAPAVSSPLLFPMPVTASIPRMGATWATLVDILDAFSDGNFYDKMLLQDLVLFVGLWVLGLLFLCARRRWKQVLLIGSPILLTAVAFVMVGVGIEKGGMRARYVIFLLPLYFIPIACGIALLSSGIGRMAEKVSSFFLPTVSYRVMQGVVLVSVIVMLGIFVDFSAYSLSTWYVSQTQNSRDALRLVAVHVQADECIIVGDKRAFEHYISGEFVVCPSNNLSKLISEYTGVWFARSGYPRSVLEDIVSDLNFATVHFDDYWMNDYRVSHWRRNVPFADLQNQLATWAVAVNSGDPSLHTDLAQSYLALHQDKQAVEQFWQAIRVRSNYQPAYEALVKYYLTVGLGARADELVQFAVEHNQHSVWPHVLRGHAFAWRGVPQAAIDEYLAAIRLNPFETGYNSYTQKYYQYPAYLYQQAGRWQDLIALYQMAARYNSNEPWPYTAMARAMLQAGHWEQAQDWAEKVIRLDPALPDGYAALADVYKVSGEAQQVPTVYQRAARANPASDWPWVALGDFYRGSRNESLAVESFFRALAIAPDSQEIRTRIGDTHWTLSSHLNDIDASSALGNQLILEDTDRWRRPYPYETGVLVSTSPLTVSRQLRPDQVFFHPFSPQAPTYIAFALDKNPFLTLNTSYALADQAAGQSNGVSYQVEVSTDGGQAFDVLAQATVTQNNWATRTVSLVPYWSRDIMVRLSADARGNDAFDWLLATLDLQAYPDRWNLVTNAWQASARCGTTKIELLAGRGFLYHNRWLVTRSKSPVQDVVRSTQVQFHPCDESIPTVLDFPLVNNPFAVLKTSFALADGAVGYSDGVRYTVAVSHSLALAPTLLLDVQVTRNEWQTVYLDLEPYRGQDIDLLFSSSPLGNEQYDWLQIEAQMFPVPLLLPAQEQATGGGNP